MVEESEAAKAKTHNRAALGVNRRQALATLSLATAGSCLLPELALAVNNTHERDPLSAPGVRFLSPEAIETVGFVADCIGHESDDPEARRRAVRYVDLVLFRSSSSVQQDFQDGLWWLDDFAKERFGSRFAKLDTAQRSRLLASVSDTQRIRQPRAHAFFTQLKQLTIESHYAANTGWR